MVEVRNLKKHFPARRKSFFGHAGVVKAVDDVSFSIPKGCTLGLVGESGSGKTTTARSILRLIEPDGGDVIIDGQNVRTMRKNDLRLFRKRMQIVFQDPYGSLNPRMTIRKIVSEPLRIHTDLSKSDIHARVEELLTLTGLEPDTADRYPHEFSGGQRQRIGIARALALNPSFVVLDEPVSALDVSIQGQILNLLMDLQDKLGLTYLFVAHDLAVVEHISTRVAVMYLGRIVENNSKDGLYRKPLHPYTQNLIKSVPRCEASKHGFSVLSGEIPSPETPPTGCHFHPRCSLAMDICTREYPKVRIVDGAEVSCHLYPE